MAEEEIEGGGGGSKSKLIIIIIVVLLLLIGAAVGAMLFLGDDTPTEEVKLEQEQMQLQEEMDKTKQTDVLNIKEPLFLPPQKYTVNLRDGRHFLSITITAVLEDQEAFDYIVRRKSLVDDRIISILQNMTTEDLKSTNGMSLLKMELLKMANNLFSPDFIESSATRDRQPVKEILLTEFILN